MNDVKSQNQYSKNDSEYQSCLFKLLFLGGNLVSGHIRVRSTGACDRAAETVSLALLQSDADNKSYCKRKKNTANYIFKRCHYNKFLSKIKKMKRC